MSTNSPLRIPPRIVASTRAAASLDELYRAEGPQIVVLSASGARVSVATVRSCKGFVPAHNQTVIGKVGRCPVYADTRQLLQCPFDTIVLDMGWRSGPPGQNLAFVTRPESKAEWQQRVFSERARKTN